MRIILPLLCALVGAAYGESEAPVALILDAATPLPTLVSTALHQEVEAIFRETGYSFNWVNRGEMRAEDSYPDLVLIRLKSACGSNPLPLATASMKGSALAWAHISEGDMLPFIEVDCARLSRMLRASGFGESEHSQRQMLGKALGRVLAHELYHVLTGSNQHSHAGVAQAVLSPALLTSSTLTFTARELALLSRRSYAARQTQQPVSSLSEEPVFESGR